VALLFPVITFFASRYFRPKLSKYKRLSFDSVNKKVFETQFPQSYFLDKTYTDNRPLEEKFETYECGEDPVGEAQIQFHFQYYMFAIIFVVFDVLVVFMMAWALVFSDLSDFAKLFMFLFLLILVITVIYALKKEEVIWI
jgi:NADH:ubiquinone oxidoreductase subunit 3 (subunit A)